MSTNQELLTSLFLRLFSPSLGLYDIKLFFLARPNEPIYFVALVEEAKTHMIDKQPTTQAIILKERIQRGLLGLIYNPLFLSPGETLSTILTNPMKPLEYKNTANETIGIQEH